jgi:hypothetical protein
MSSAGTRVDQTRMRDHSCDWGRKGQIGPLWAEGARKQTIVDEGAERFSVKRIKRSRYGRRPDLIHSPSDLLWFNNINLERPYTFHFAFNLVARLEKYRRYARKPYAGWGSSADDVARFER